MSFNIKASPFLVNFKFNLKIFEFLKTQLGATRLRVLFSDSLLAAGGKEQALSGSRIRQRRRGVLQRRFWEHALRDEEDYARHFDYIHYNPVKHRYVESVQDWPYSTFHRWVKQGVYPPDWSNKANGIMEFDDLDTTAME